MNNLKSERCFFIFLKMNQSCGPCGNKSLRLNTKNKISQHFPNSCWKSHTSPFPMINGYDMKCKFLCPAMDISRWTFVHSFKLFLPRACYMLGMVLGSENQFLGEGLQTRWIPDCNQVLDLQGISGVTGANRRMVKEMKNGICLVFLIYFIKWFLTVTFQVVSFLRTSLGLSFLPSCRNPQWLNFSPFGSAWFVYIPLGTTLLLLSSSYLVEAKVIQGRRNFPYLGDTNSPD